MKTIWYYLLILCCIGIISSCEKDDICVEGNTPLLIVRFYDETDTTQTKAVSNLTIQGVGNELLFPVASADSIAIPLKTLENSTAFTLTLNGASTDTTVVKNPDTVTFTYTVKEVFISRACGYIANFTNINASVTSDSDNWIKQIIIQQQNVENETSAHIKIYH